MIPVSKSKGLFNTSPFDVSKEVNSAFKEAFPIGKPTNVVAELPSQLGKNPLMIKSIMEGSVLERQVSKTGMINKNNIISHIASKKTSPSDKVILKKTLDKFTDNSSIDYTKFKNAVSKELVSLETTTTNTYANYGINRLGFPEADLKSVQAELKANKSNVKKISDALSSGRHTGSDRLILKKH
jgi:hypothetical protein